MKIVENCNFEKSSFCHVFRKDDVVCLYNSLNLEIAFCNEIALTLLNDVTKTKSFLEVFKKYPSCTEKQLKDCLRKLISCGFLVRSSAHELSKIEEIRHKISSISTLKVMYLIPTWNCNLACRYCHIRSIHYGKKRTMMSKEVAKKSIVYFFKNSPPNEDKEIMFYGGEPFLNEDVIKYSIKMIRLKQTDFSGEVQITVFTNGTKVTKDIAELLASEDVFVIVSMDGPKEVHDKMRIYPDGKGTFSDVLKGYFLYKDSGCRVGISCVIGAHNIDNLEDIIRFFVKELQPVDIGLSTLHLLPSGHNPAYVPIRKLTEQLIKAYQVCREMGFYPEHIMRRLRPFVEKIPRLKDCPSCGGKIVVDPEGKIGLCEAFLAQDMFLINTNNPFTDANYTEWNVLSQFNRDTCLSCPALSICGGGCPYDAYVVTGSIQGVDKIRCAQSNMILRWAVWDLFEHIRDKFEKLIKQNPVALYVPTLKERRSIYGKISYPIGPLKVYSTFGESYRHANRGVIFRYLEEK